MNEWDPATEAEAAMRDALAAADQDLYFRILSRSELLLPVSADALAGRAPMGWGTWTTGDRTHILAFTSPNALRICLNEPSGSFRALPFRSLADDWPNYEWWLAINPGLPIEAYLPSWFVSQLTRDEVRLPGRTMGARARMAQGDRAPQGDRMGQPGRVSQTDRVSQSDLASALGARARAAGPARPNVPPATPLPLPPTPAPAAPSSRLGASEPVSARVVNSSNGRQPVETVDAEIIDYPAVAGSARVYAGPSSADPGDNPQSYDPQSYAAQSYDPQSYDPQSYDRQGHAAQGYDAQGYDAQGYDAQGYDAQGYDAQGPDGQGYAGQGYADAGYDRQAYADGYRGQSHADQGYGEQGYGDQGYTDQGYAGQAYAGHGYAGAGYPAASGYGYEPGYGSATGHDSRGPAPADPGSFFRTAAERERADWERQERERIDRGQADRGQTGQDRGYADPGERTTRIGERDLGARLRERLHGYTGTAPRYGGATVGFSGDRQGQPAAAASPSWTPRQATIQDAEIVSPAESWAVGFAPANETESNLLAAAEDNNTDAFLSTLLLARVILPVPISMPPGSRPRDKYFPWQIEENDGQRVIAVFTSPERMTDYGQSRFGPDISSMSMRFIELIGAWPSAKIQFAINPGSPVGATLPGSQIVALAAWAAEVGLRDEPAGEVVVAAKKNEAVPSMGVAGAPTAGAAKATIMQRTVPPTQLAFYVERGYDRVSGFVNRASEVAHLTTPQALYRALGLLYSGSPFSEDDAEVHVLRWVAHRPDLYRLPYGGQHKAGMRAMQGWVIERAPFRGNGFAPGDTDVVAEFKVDSARLPHGAQMWRLGKDGSETLRASFDADAGKWVPTP